ncbi:VOC family protein [soil metagenome]
MSIDSVQWAHIHLRVDRPSNDLDAVVKFYRDTLDFTLLGEFKDHDGFDGVMLGHPESCFHLEFTHKHGHTAGLAPSEEHLLIFYLPDAIKWQHAVEQLERSGHQPVNAFNPYWDQHGKTYEDPDGYRVVLQNAAWRMNNVRTES